MIRNQLNFFNLTFRYLKDTETVAQEAENRPKMASRGLLDGPWGAGSPEAYANRDLSDFKPFWASPGGGLGGLWGALGPPLGPLVSAGLLCLFSSRRCSYFARCENGRHALRTVKTNERFCAVVQGGRAATKSLGMTRERPRRPRKKLPQGPKSINFLFSCPRCLENGVVE